ncbi:MAG: hypothetical protein LBP53_06860 [Candidatus Peribacteria bacterium]|nr:hypothetical protein [Candidatus Peribacteria bacterium]
MQEVVEKCITALQQEGLFFESSSNVHQGKISFQITSNDREVLQIFADWYKRIENFTQITKKDVVAQAKQALVAFIASQQLENVDQVQERLTQSIVKVLVK